MVYFLGVDAGGSKCRARLTDRHGTVIGTGLAGPANAGIGYERLHAVLLDVIGQAVNEAGLSEEQAGTIAACFGVAGTSRPGGRAEIERLEFPFPVRLETDAVIANTGAHAGRDGAILILGTGSIAQVRAGGRNFSIGGYGFPISDEGSGAALGLSAMRHSLRALDGRTRRTPLSEEVSGRFGDDTARAIDWMDTARPGDYAQFAPLVLRHAEAGDAIARNIVQDAANHIEQFIETIFARGAPNCALMGGLSDPMRPWLRERTTARLVQPIGDSLDGALRLAGLDRPIAS